MNVETACSKGARGTTHSTSDLVDFVFQPCICQRHVLGNLDIGRATFLDQLLEPFFFIPGLFLSLKLLHFPQLLLRVRFDFLQLAHVERTWIDGSSCP